jgi:hypothetical protein
MQVSKQEIHAIGIGREGQTLVTIDNFAGDPDALRRAAIETRFEPGRHHYPGIRAELPPTYLEAQLPLITRIVRQIFGRYGDVKVVDASFSIVTTPPDQLSLQQRLPHCDAFDPGRIAFIHYLMPAGGHEIVDKGTAFYRHRSTGFETVNEARRAPYFQSLESELRERGEPQGYVAGDTELFEQIGVVEARYDRALLYPGFLLHSGAIPADASLSPDPAAGRLTVTAFLSVA